MTPDDIKLPAYGFSFSPPLEDEFSTESFYAIFLQGTDAKVSTDRETAYNSAKRLAQLNPGHRYVVMRAETAFRSTSSPPEETPLR